MFLSRSLGSILRGNATPAQLTLACTLGSIIGFIPIAHAPGMLILFTLILIVLNANLVLAALITILTKLLGLLALPLTFNLGQFLLDGPTQPLFKSVINTPVLALCGFTNYVAVGGLALGLIIGILLALIVNKSVSAFRNKMADVEESSESYKKWSQKRPVRILTWLLLGGRTKGTYKEVLQRKGKVIRPLGVIVLVGFAVLAVLLQMFFSDQLVTYYLRSGLERVNGATVDIDSAQLDLAEGKMTVNLLAIADSKNLDTDLFRAEKLELDFALSDLLTKRFKIDRIVATGVRTNEKRSSPAFIVNPPPDPPEPPKDSKSIEDYLEDAKLWKKRLEQLHTWLQRISSAWQKVKGKPGEAAESLGDKLEREAKRLGYRNVYATHLVDAAPSATIVITDAGKVPFKFLGDETVDVNAKFLSTHPHLLENPAQVTLVSSNNTLNIALNLAGLTKAPDASKPNTFSFLYRNIKTDDFIKNLKLLKDGGFIKGGTIDAAFSGKLDLSGPPAIDSSIAVTMHNVTITHGGQSAPIKELTFPIGLKGPLAAPAINYDTAVILAAIKKQLPQIALGLARQYGIDTSQLHGAEQLLADWDPEKAQQLVTNAVQDQVNKQLDKQKDDIKKKIGDKIGDEIKNKIPGINIPGLNNNPQNKKDDSKDSKKDKPKSPDGIKLPGGLDDAIKDFNPFSSKKDKKKD